MPITATITQFTGGAAADTSSQGQVEFVKSTEFITNLDLKECGCLETTSDNLTRLQEAAPDIYGCYYAACCACDMSVGSYRVFEESGLIQFDFGFKPSSVYIEYEGSLPKVNGQLQVPEVAFEAIVNGVKYRSIADKKNEPRWRIKDLEDRSTKSKRAMLRVLGRVSLSSIVLAASKLPKFDYRSERWHDCFSSATHTTISATTTTTETISASGGTTVIEVTKNGIAFEKLRFTIGETDLIFSGQTELVLNFKNVMPKSLNILLGNVPLEEGEDYTVQFGASSSVVTFTQGVSTSKKYTTTFARSLATHIIGADMVTGNGSYLHTQTIPQTVWTMNHNLGFEPNVALEDKDGNTLHGDTSHPSVYTTVVTFINPQTGKANLS